MIGLGKKGRSVMTADVLLAFVQSWELHGSDETSICSGTLDVVRAYLGERPCCVWKTDGPRLVKVSERGMVDLYLGSGAGDHQAALSRALASGKPEFDACPIEALPDDQMTFDGFLHIPIKNRGTLLGLLSLAVLKKESRSRDFVEPLESLGRLVAIAFFHGDNREANMSRERELKAEVDSTLRELEGTNRKLIDRVRELKTLYRELQRRVQELTDANKAKDEFLSLVSHELRTPLTSLNGFLSVLLDEEAGPVNEQQRKFLSISKQSAVRLNGIISDLLDISRIQSGRLNLDMGECSVYDLLWKTVEKLKEAAHKKGLQVRLQAAVTLPAAWGDAARLQQVTENLISNAIKFTDAGGEIDVFGEEKGDFLQVSVRDTGPGLTEEEQSRVFDMFYQADTSNRRSAGGTGLGLAIAKGILMMHGGQLLVHSEKGKGATFSYLVPRRKSQKAA